MAPNQNCLTLFLYADRADCWLMAAGTLASIANGLSLPAFYYFCARIWQIYAESRTNPQQAADDVAKFALYLLFLGLVSLVCSFAGMVCWRHTGQRQATQLRRAWLQAILSQKKYHFSSGDEIERAAQAFTADSSWVEKAILQMETLVCLLAICLGGFGVASFLMWKIGVAMLACACIAALFSCLLDSVWLVWRYGEFRLSIVERSVDCIRTVYSNVYEMQVASDFAASAILDFELWFARGFICAMVTGCRVFLFASFLWYAGLLVHNSEVTGGKALAAILATFEATNALSCAFSSRYVLDDGKKAIRKIVQMLGTQNEEVSEKGSKLSQVKGDLEIRNVKFSYPSRPYNVILHHVSFSIPSGQVVALVGACGSGKSTVVFLIHSLYKPTEGEILLDNTNICNFNPSWYRNQLALLTDEPLIFGTSILENIRFWNKHATREQVEAAAKEANAHNFILKLPNGYETQIGGLDVLLSHGQLQRVAIARAFLKNPKILLLDEPTRGLNAMCERPIQQALEQLMGQRTTLIVAHRLSTIQNAFTVNVLQDGRIVEMGTHSQLTSRNEYGPYSSLVKVNQMAAGDDGTILGRTAKAARTKSKLLFRLPKNNMKNVDVEPIRHEECQESGVDEEPANDDGGQPVAAKRLTSQLMIFKAVVWRLAKMSVPLWSCVLLGSLSAIMCGMLVSPISGYVLGKLLQVYYETDAHRMRHGVQKYVLLLVGAGVAGGGIQWMYMYYFVVVAETITARIKEAAFEGMLKQEVGWYDGEDHSGKRLKEKLADPNNVHNIFSSLATFLNCTSCFITGFIMGFVIEWRFTLFMLLMFSFLVIGAMGQKFVTIGFEPLINSPPAHLTTIVKDFIGKIRLISASSSVSETVAVFESAVSKSVKQALVCSCKWSLLVCISRLMLFGTHGLVLWYGSRLFKNGTSDFGPIILVYMIISTSASKFAEMLQPTVWAIESFQTLGSVCALIDRETSIHPEEGSSEILQSIAGTVEFNDVDFAYPTRPDVTIFKGLNLNVKAKQQIALVGAQGSGKSALVALVERFYDANRGTVMIDGKDIKKLNLRSLRRLIGFVQSDPVLFPTSIRENIICGKKHVNQRELQEAAEAAEAHIFISALPNGYNTRVDLPGVALNMGQRQRIAIARAILKNPPILLVDDATSSLDSKEAKCVQEVLEHLMLDRTTILVTHNLIDTCCVVNSICVLEGGRIVEQGSHNELMEAGGSYACLFNIQRARDQQRHRLP